MHAESVALVNDVCPLVLSPPDSHEDIDAFHIEIQTVGAALSRAYTAGGRVLGANKRSLPRASHKFRRSGDSEKPCTDFIKHSHEMWSDWDQIRTGYHLDRTQNKP